METSLWFIFCQSDLLLEKHADGTFSVPSGAEPPVAAKPWNTVHAVSSPRGVTVQTFRIDTPPAGLPSYELCPLRKTFYHLPREHYLMAGKCYEINYWDQNNRFCGVCGGAMKKTGAISKRCTHCGKEIWPQLSPAVIVLVHRGDEVLMVRARNFRGDFYGLVAGFVEPGETLEEAVVREVQEETGITIANIRYFSSQPWPYPCGLMVGFHADYVSGTIRLQHEELSSGGWFHRGNLPQLPEKLSIARQLIDSWLEESNTK